MEKTKRKKRKMEKTKISDLPDDILRLILRSARNADRFRGQSRKFRDMFKIVHHVELVYSKTPFVGSFTEYVNGVVLGLPEYSTRVRKFTLKCSETETGLDQSDINRWLCRMLNCGVVEIEMCINGGYSLPLGILNCRTVRKLRLGSGFAISVVPLNAELPVLETLFLDSLRFDYDALGGRCAFQALLRACSVLKELVIEGTSWESWNWSGVLSSPSLERLTIFRAFSHDYIVPGYLRITFDTPSLEYFDYTGFVADEYPNVNFPSLVRAKLQLQLVVNHQWGGDLVLDDDAITSNPTNLINGIRNVHILELSSSQTFDILYLFRDAIPMFPNLHHLTMVHNALPYCWRFLPFVLDKAPNLKTLFIEGLLHYDEETNDVCECVSEYSCLLSCHLEILQIKLHENGTVGELKQVKHFLRKLSRLLLLQVHLMPGLSFAEGSKIFTKLEGFPRASPNCVIKFISEP